MNTTTAKLIFYVGTLTSAVLFLILTYDTHRQINVLTHTDQLSDEVVSGKRVFEKYNCNDCHTILGFGGYYAPDLTKVYQRRGESYIRNVISHPDEVLAKSFRKMPQQNIPDENINTMISFFKWVNNIDNHDWPPQDSKKRRSSAINRLMESTTVSLGAALFKENNCFECHKLRGIGGDKGPVLDNVGNRRDSETIKKIITNPVSVNPQATMPDFNDLSGENVQALAEFLIKQKEGE